MANLRVELQFLLLWCWSTCVRRAGAYCWPLTLAHTVCGCTDIELLARPSVSALDKGTALTALGLAGHDVDVDDLGADVRWLKTSTHR